MARHTQEANGELQSQSNKSDKEGFSILALGRSIKKQAKEHPVRTGLIGGGGLTTLIGGGIFAGNVLRGPADGAPAPTGTSTAAPLVPTAEPSPTATEVAPDPSQAYEFGIEKSTVDALIAPGQEALLARPIEERIVIPLYYAQEELVDFAEEFHDQSKDPNDVIPAGGLSAESPVEDVHAFLFHMQDIAITRERADNDYFIDPVAGKAILAGLSINGANSLPYINFTQNIDDFVKIQETPDAQAVNSAWSLAEGGRRIPPIVEGSAVKSTDSAGRPCWNYKVLLTDGSEISVSACWVTNTNSAIKAAGMWASSN